MLLIIYMQSKLVEETGYERQNASSIKTGVLQFMLESP